MLIKWLETHSVGSVRSEKSLRKGREMKINSLRVLSGRFLSLALFALIVPHGTAQTYTTLASFDSPISGTAPYVAPIQGPNGNFYGTAGESGPNGEGTIYDVTPSGTLTVLHSFEGADGGWPQAPFIMTAAGNLFSTTFAGGESNLGAIYEVTTNGTVTTLHSFDGTDGVNPVAGVILARDGNFYGVTSGTNAPYGTIFKFTPAGKLTTLHSFCLNSACLDGAFPYASLVQGTDGKLYGTAANGGAHGGGTIYRITPAGSLSVLYAFCSLRNCADGTYATTGLIQGTDGNFYGTTTQGGAFGGGTVFKITPAGTYSVLHTFCAESSCADGSGPNGPLVQASDGDFYGTTQVGGTHLNTGVVFKLTPAGQYSTLYDFCSQTSCTDGSAPYAPLMQGTDGSLYGTTAEGGSTNSGVVFQVSAGLPAFAEAVPDFGRIGAQVMILGNRLIGTTRVSFTGITAAFTVVSDTEILATVPTGATTGKVTLTTTHGNLETSVSFQVTK